MITGWLLVLASFIAAVVGWDTTVNGVELLALVLAVVGFSILTARATR